MTHTITLVTRPVLTQTSYNIGYPAREEVFGMFLARPLGVISAPDPRRWDKWLGNVTVPFDKPTLPYDLPRVWSRVWYTKVKRIRDGHKTLFTFNVTFI